MSEPAAARPGRPHPDISWLRLLVAVLLGCVMAEILFVFWMFVCDGLLSFARDPNPAKSSLLVIFALQVLPLTLLLAVTLLPKFVPWAAPLALLAAWLLLRRGVRSPGGFALGGAVAGFFCALIVPALRGTLFAAAPSTLTSGNMVIPALIAGASGGLTAWGIAFGLPPGKRPAP